jgi:hypothetical protein
MAQELLRQGSSSSAAAGDNDDGFGMTVSGNEDGGSRDILHETKKLQVDIPYQKMGTIGTLYLEKVQSSFAMFDEASLRFLYWDFVQNAHWKSTSNRSSNNNEQTAAVDKKNKCKLCKQPQIEQHQMPTKEQVLVAFEAWKTQPLPTSSSNSDVFGKVNTIISSNQGVSAAIDTSVAAAKRRKIKGKSANQNGRRKRTKGPLYDSD